MNRKIKAAVIGVGHLGQHHARILASLPQVTLACVADADPVRGREIAARHGAVFVPDYREIIGVDAVSVVVPTALHYTVADYFLKKKCDVLVEKPFTTTSAQAARLVKLAGRNRRILQVGHVERFNGAVLQLQHYVTNPLFIEIHRLSSFPQRSIDVGVVLDIMIHDLDIVLSLVNSRVTRIQAVGAKVLTRREDIANVRLEFASGCIANLTASRMSWQPQRRLRIFQKHDYLSLDYQNQTLHRFKYPALNRKSVMPSQKDIEVIPVPVEKTEPLRRELEFFIDSIRTRKQPKVSGETGRDVLNLALKILSRMKTNR